MTTLGVCLIVKDEALRITTTLESIKTICNSLIIIDTISNDDTVNVIKAFAKANNIILYITTSVFKDFSTNRNELLQYANDKADWLLLLDSNDEIVDAKGLRKSIDEYKGNHIGFYVNHKWQDGSNIECFKNIKLIKSNSGWRYTHRVHEVISCDQMDKSDGKTDEIVALNNCFAIYQDRSFDNAKSFLRFEHDKKVLYEDYQQDSYNGRTVYYLAQTFECLYDWQNAYRFYKIRLTLSGFGEEVYNSLYRLGEIARRLKHEREEYIFFYLKAYEYSCAQSDTPRFEPLYMLANHYNSLANYRCAYMYIKACCECKYPSTAVLGVNDTIYNSLRWSLCKEINSKIVKHYR